MLMKPRAIKLKWTTADRCRSTSPVSGKALSAFRMTLEMVTEDLSSTQKKNENKFDVKVYPRT